MKFSKATTTTKSSLEFRRSLTRVSGIVGNIRPIFSASSKIENFRRKTEKNPNISPKPKSLDCLFFPIGPKIGRTLVPGKVRSFTKLKLLTFYYKKLTSFIAEQFCKPSYFETIMTVMLFIYSSNVRNKTVKQMNLNMVVSH